MQVAIDATPLTAPNSGIARYVRELTCALVEHFPEDQFTLVSDQPFQSPCGAARGRGPGNVLERRWWLYGVQRELSRCGGQVFHGTHFTVPWLPLRPSVMTIHDMSPWLDPRWDSGAAFVRRRTPYLVGLGVATRIITPTEAVRREVLTRFRVPSDRVRAVPHAASACFRPVPAAPRCAPYFLCVSSVEPRKNVDMLVAAWREVHRLYGIELVLVGPSRKGFLAPPPEPGLHSRGEVADAELSTLYSSAVAVLYPSHYEGFGFPVLEAMQCGALVIASRDPAIREVAAEAALLLDSDDALAWTAAMEAAATHRDPLNQLRARALERARHFSWARTAKSTRDVYFEAIRTFRE